MLFYKLHNNQENNLIPAEIEEATKRGASFDLLSTKSGRTG